MLRLLGVAACAALLSSCAAPAFVGVASAISAGGTVALAIDRTETDINTVLKIDKPIKQAICDSHPDKGPKFKAWCDHLPSDMESLMLQWAAVSAAH